MISLQEVSKVFNPGAGNEFSPIRGITIRIEPGKSLVLKGPSGSGKTTLLSLIGCMTRPTAGRIKIEGAAVAEIFGVGPGEPVEVSTLPERYLALVRRKMFGFVFQQFNLVRGITAIENVMLPAYPAGEPRGVLRHRAELLLDRLSVSHRASARVELLSGGEQQRVAIARALINGPAVLIADEPTAHLDSALSHGFLEIAESLKSSGMTLIIASHDPLVFQASFVDLIEEVRDGLLSPRDER